MMTPLPWPPSPAAGPAARRRRGGWRLGALAAALAVAVAGAAAADEPGLSISDAWMRLVIPSRPAAGYFKLSNATATPRTLVGAASPACGMLMLHRSLHDSGEDRMVMVKSVAVPAHGSLAFAPGGYHLMCMSPAKTMTHGSSVPVTLRFSDGGTVTANFPVRNAAGK